jgi:hypothetical protein
MKKKENNFKDAFDHAMMHAFEDAEMEPRPEVWEKINADLDRKKAFILGKKLKLYQMIAASMGLLFAASLLLWWQPFGYNSQLTSMDTERNSSAGETIGAKEVPDRNINLAEKQTNLSNDISEQNLIANNSKSGSNLQSATTNVDQQSPTSPHYNLSIGSLQEKPEITTTHLQSPNDKLYGKDIPELQSLQALDYDFVDMVLADKPYLRKVDLWSILYGEEEAEGEEIFHQAIQAGLLASSGIFSPNFNTGQMSSQEMMTASDNRGLMSSDNTVEEKSTPNIAFAIGVGANVKLKPKFWLKTGIGFARGSSTVKNASMVINYENLLYPAYFTASNYDALKYTQESNFEGDFINSFEFITVPILAAYRLVDKRITLDVSGGLSPDFFVKNKLSDPQGIYPELVIGNNSDSPFRPVIVSAQIGFEAGLKLNDQLNLSFEPSFRNAISAFTRNESPVNSFPASFMLGFGLKYQIQ